MNASSALSRVAPLLAAALIFTGSHAFGQFTESPMQSPLSWTIVGTSGNQNLSFDGFNTNGGQYVLTSVTIDLTNVVISGNATLTANTINQTVTYARLEGDFIVTDTNNDTVEADVQSAKGPAEAVAQGSTYYVLGGANYPAGNNGYVGTSPPAGAMNVTAGPLSATPTVITSNLTSFEGGSDAVVLNLSGGTNLTSSTSGGFNTSVTGTATGDVTVIYTYTTAVPEPSKTTACMIGFALMVLVGRTYFKGRGTRTA